MSIDSVNQNVIFTSRYCPIKPCKVKTPKGELMVYEPTMKEIRQKGFVENVTDFFFLKFTKDTNDPSWLRFQLPENANLFKIFKEQNYPIYRGILENNDGHTSLVLAKDEKGKIRGACLAYSCDEIPECSETTLYIDSLAVDEDYRHQHLASLLLEKCMEAGRGYFSDIFLLGEKLARGFYNKQGFVALNENDAVQKKVIDYISQERFDCPRYVTPLTKPLDVDKPRWYIKAAKYIEKLSSPNQENKEFLFGENPFNSFIM